LVITRYGIVATEHPIASQIGADILFAGWECRHAGVAANARYGRFRSDGQRIGGDLFAIVYEAKSGKLYGLNASGWSPAVSRREFLKAKGNKRNAHKRHPFRNRSGRG